MRFEHDPLATSKIYSEISPIEETIIATATRRYRHAAQTGRIILSAEDADTLDFVIQNFKVKPTNPLQEFRANIGHFQLLIAAVQADMPNLDHANTYITAHMVIDMRDACIESETQQFARTIPDYLPDMPDLNS